MSLLLLQARKKSDAAATHEHEAFARVIGVGKAQITAWDLLQGPPSTDELLAADCVLVGGSGDFSVNDAGEHGWISDFIDTMGHLTTLDIPVFASCFGFQALIVACGGRIVSDATRAEFGTFELTVSEEGRADPLFRDLVPSFWAQFGHAEYAASLPSEFVNLAGSERNEYQAARVREKNIYLTQFHPELSMKANRERALMYIDAYAEKGLLVGDAGIPTNFRESASASNVLRRFVREPVGSVS